MEVASGVGAEEAVRRLRAALVPTRTVAVPAGCLVGSLTGPRLRAHPPAGGRFPPVLDVTVYTAPHGCVVRGWVRLHAAVRPLLVGMGLLEAVLVVLAAAEVSVRGAAAGAVLVLPLVFAALTVPLALLSRRLPAEGVGELRDWLCAVVAADDTTPQGAPGGAAAAPGGAAAGSGLPEAASPAGPPP